MMALCPTQWPCVLHDGPVLLSGAEAEGQRVSEAAPGAGEDGRGTRGAHSQSL